MDGLSPSSVFLPRPERLAGLVPVSLMQDAAPAEMPVAVILFSISDGLRHQNRMAANASRFPASMGALIVPPLPDVGVS